MKKFLLIVLVGMVLAMDLYGIVEELKVDEVKEVNHVEETTTTVYME